MICLGFKQFADHKVDLLNKKKVEKIIAKTKPDIVTNLAAITNVDFCEKNKSLCKKLNFNFVRNLVSFSKKYNFKVIQISTDQLYNKNKYNLEKDVKILNYYAKTKFMSDEIVKKNGGCVLRTNFFGIDKKNDKGLVNWIRRNHQTKQKISLFKNIYFSPININTLVKYIDLICEKFKPGIYNVGSKNRISKAEFGKKVINKLKLNIIFDEVDYRYKKSMLFAKRPLHMHMNVSNFEKTFSVKAPKIEKEIINLK